MQKLFYAAVVALGLFSHAAAHANEPVKVGVVGVLNPAVNTKSADGTTRTLVVSNPIYFQETIQTDAKGNIQVMFLDRSALTIGPNSSVTIDKFVYNPESSSGELAIKSTKGTLRFIGGVLSKKDAVKIVTPVSTIGIRGGIAMVDTNADSGASNATFVYGTEMTVTNEQGTVSTTSPGNMVNVASANTPPSPPVPVDLGQMASSMQSLSPAPGTNGGATTIPTSDSINQKLEKMDQTVQQHDSGTSSAAPEGGQAASSGNDSGNQSGDGSESQSADNGSASAGTTNDSAGGSQQSSDTSSTTPTFAEKKGPDAPASGGNVPAANTVPAISTVPAIGNVAEGTKGSTTLREQVAGGGCANGQGGALCERAKEAFGGTIPNQSGSTGSTTPPPSTTPPVDTGTLPPPPANTGTTTTAANNGGTAPVYRAVEGFAVHNGSTLDKGSIDVPDDLAYNTAASVTVMLHPFDNSGDFNLPLTLNNGANGYLNLSSALSASPIVADDDTYNSGFTISSLNHYMHYHYLLDTTQGKELKTIIGNPLLPTNLPTSDITMYDFLPGMEYKIYGSSSMTRFGLFNHNFYGGLGSAILPSHSSEISMLPNLPGMVVDWGKNRFIVAHIDLTRNSFTNYNNRLLVSFGDVGRSAGNPILHGPVYDFKISGTGDFFGRSGIEAMPSMVYGGDVGGNPFVDGFMVRTTNGNFMGADTGVMSQVAFGRDPAEGVASSIATNISQNNALTAGSSKQLEGFSAGYYKVGGGTPSSFMMWNGANTGDVSVYVDDTVASQGVKVGSRFYMADTVDPDRFVDARFGKISGSSADNAYVADNLYAASSGALSYVNELGTAEATVSHDGVAVSAEQFTATSLPTYQCTGCNYAHWGVWAVKADVNDGTTTHTDSTHMVPYVAGQITSYDQLVSQAALGTSVPFSGAAIGQIRDLSVANGTINNATGSFSSTVNFAARTISNFNLTFGGYSGIAGSGSGLICGGGCTSANKAVFAPITLTGGGITGGQVNAALFGPAAQNMAGNFKFTQTGMADAAGVFIGKR